MSSFGERLGQRQKGFKKVADSEDARRKREDATVQLRKQTREDALRKKRMMSDPPPGQQLMVNGGMPDILGKIAVLAQAISSESSHPQAQFEATQHLRKLLSVDQKPPIQEVISAGLVPHMVEFMRDMTRTSLQIEAEWVLNIIASGGMPEHIWAVVDAGALPIFLQLLESSHEDVREQAVWALGNIAGESSTLRDFVIHSGGLNPIIKVVRELTTLSLTRNATWVLSNLCRGTPPPLLEWVAPAISTLSQLIHSIDEEVLADACWALACISDGQQERIEAVLTAGVCQRLVDLLAHRSPRVQLPALRAVGNIVLGNENQTEAVLLCEPLPLFLQLLTHQNRTMQKEACWAISNIMAGNYDQVQQVISNGLVPLVVHLLRTADFDIKKEAAWVIKNATACQVPEQIDHLVQCGCIPPLVEMLSLSDVKVVSVALNALENILKVGQNQQHQMGLPFNTLAELVEQADGLMQIEVLQDDQNDNISERATRILEEQFP